MMQSKEVEKLIRQGEDDLTTMVRFSVKFYITPEVTLAYQNATKSLEYLTEILNEQYTISLGLPLKCLSTEKLI